MSILIKVQSEDFDQGDLHKSLSDNKRDGAIVTFTGLVREFSAGDNVIALELEHYPGMTQQLLLKIAEQAKVRWSLGKIVIVHRVGYLPLGEQIVFVGVSSQHRLAAFEGAQFIMDYLKNQATFWKKEHFEHSSKWVEFKQSDKHALDKWKS
ncbi:molybdopterin synthase catalytic subunit MoaE [Pseudoalteromonas sp. MMG010]|uniref:molybdopterin synthase catalytic subunit MoaE n=1 Tax=Pseudoalteromonas sp. MMG010 TaxID=2822685 RepID=UPI001B3A0B10|nr:molybdopterin synthase catalytic subunit MoaE [Pseudoalteromonas sp. MMG010]MBQ4832280.1 molybdopterin synthase catalytic subunit MoaE [Pseudoalteromonas sp. MMG010]